MKKDKPPSKDTPGTYGFAPLGYVELSGIREALQKATDAINRLERENEKLKRRLQGSGPGQTREEKKQGWDYSHLNDTERRVIEAFLKGDVRELGVKQTCRRLSRKYGLKDTTYRKVYAKLRDYGVLKRLRTEGS